MKSRRPSLQLSVNCRLLLLEASDYLLADDTVDED